MSGWTLKESDLNIRCTNCSHSLVPKLFIRIQDYDNIKRYLSGSLETGEKELDSSSPRMNKSMSPVKSDEQHPFLNLDNGEVGASVVGDSNTTSSSLCDPPGGVQREKSTSPKKTNGQQRAASQIKLDSSEFTVQYLSPVVLRKEFENIILNSAKRESDECMIDSMFIREHEVIFWNLLWYFKRIGVDTGHLSTILLNTRLNELHKKLKPESTDGKYDINLNE